MKRLFFSAAALILLLSASALLARPGILKTKSGQTYNGDIKDDGDTYTVTVDKIDTQISKTDVLSIAYTGSIDEQFNQRIAALDPKDAEGRVKVARFAFDNGRNDLAVQALSAAMQIDPNNADALEMLKTVEAQQTLDQGRSSAAPPPDQPAAAGAAPAGAPADSPVGPAGDSEALPTAPIPKRLLTPRDINSIRQHEIHPGEDIPISIPTAVKRNFAASVGMSYSDFDALTPADQLNQILQKGNIDMQNAVKIGRDPDAIMQFKRLIQPMVLRNCATIGCHGGPAGGTFILYDSNDQASTYTNFYIMEQFSMKTASSGGFFGGGGERKMIERGDGAHSILVDMGLPPGQGDVSHPHIPNSNFNGIFHSRDDRLYRQTIDWMDHGLNLIEPNYGISYVPPVASTQPSTLP